VSIFCYYGSLVACGPELVPRGGHLVFLFGFSVLKEIWLLKDVNRFGLQLFWFGFSSNRTNLTFL